jgi:predicted alpha-1,2-mannosidase
MVRALDCLRVVILVCGMGMLVPFLRAQSGTVAHYVDPFLGVDGGGNVFPGATLPFGMVKLGPDTEDLTANAGYSSTARIIGFSHLHVSGTGGGAKYGNILVLPFTGAVGPGSSASDRTDESAAPGYYRTRLVRYGVTAELTATHRVGFHRYTFPASHEAHVIIDVAHCLTASFASEAQKFVGGEVRVVSPSEIEGVGRYRGGWNLGGEYAVFFYAVSDTPAKSSGTWKSMTLSRDQRARTDNADPLGAYFDYDTADGQVIHMKVGISFLSVEQARRNLRLEAPAWNFEAVRKSALQQWEQSLSRIRIKGASDALGQAFYTAVYHNLLMPSDRTGENPKWISAEPYYDDYYAIWDTFRTSNPLLTLIQPHRQADLVRSLIDIYRHEGYMPDARSGNDNGRTQGGSNANVLVADAFVKGLPGIDYQTALEAMIKDAEVPPRDPQKEGRGGLKDYNNRGYVTMSDERSGSRTMEYAYDDFAIAQVAHGLKNDTAYARYVGRASNWRNLWDDKMSAEGITGFIRPRNADGTWLASFSPETGGSWPDFFYESNSWEYSLYVPQDMRALIAKCGGNEAFVKRLDTLFDHNYYNVGNEPGFLLPILYVWAGRHDRTADRVTEIVQRHFHNGRSGLPGNDDSGAMSAWFAFHAMGFFPIAGQDVYVIGTPSIAETEIDLGNGRTFRIVAEGLDEQQRNRYVGSATLNGKPLDRAWFRHGEIRDGATLVLQMSDRPSNWGATNSPPSLSDRGQAATDAAPQFRPHEKGTAARGGDGNH